MQQLENWNLVTLCPILGPGCPCAAPDDRAGRHPGAGRLGEQVIRYWQGQAISLVDLSDHRAAMADAEATTQFVAVHDDMPVAICRADAAASDQVFNQPAGGVTKRTALKRS